MSPALYSFPDPTLDDPNDPLRPRYRPLEDDAADTDSPWNPSTSSSSSLGGDAKASSNSSDPSWPTFGDLWPKSPADSSTGSASSTTSQDDPLRPPGQPGGARFPQPPAPGPWLDAAGTTTHDSSATAAPPAVPAPPPTPAPDDSNAAPKRGFLVQPGGGIWMQNDFYKGDPHQIADDQHFTPAERRDLELQLEGQQDAAARNVGNDAPSLAEKIVAVPGLVLDGASNAVLGLGGGEYGADAIRQFGAPLHAAETLGLAHSTDDPALNRQVGALQDLAMLGGAASDPHPPTAFPSQIQSRPFASVEPLPATRDPWSEVPVQIPPDLQAPKAASPSPGTPAPTAPVSGEPSFLSTTAPPASAGGQTEPSTVISKHAPGTTQANAGGTGANDPQNRGAYGQNPLRAAAAYIRGAQDADGGQRPLPGTAPGAEDPHLEAWAKSLGLPTDWQPPADAIPMPGGTEHYVWKSADNGTIYKLTKSFPDGGQTGASPQLNPDISGEWGLLPSLPSDYLDSKGLNNDIFKTDTQLEGLSPGPNGWHIATSEPVIKAADKAQPYPQDLTDVSNLLGNAGFNPVTTQKTINGVPTTVTEDWYHPQLNVMASDVKPNNFIQTVNGPVPVDLIMRDLSNPPDAATAQLQNLVTQDMTPWTPEWRPPPSASPPSPPPNPSNPPGLQAAPLRHGRLPLQTFAKLPDHLPATEAQRYGILRTTLGIYQSHFPALRRRFRKGHTTGRSGLECRFRDPSGRITPQSVHGALIAVHEPKLARDMKGLSPRHCAFHVAHALGEEVRHLASLHAALALWQHSNQHVPFESWLKDHHTRMWQQDFTPRQGYAVLRTYLHHFPSNSPAKSLTNQSNSSSPTSPEDWQLALEALRMFSQARAGTLPTESDQLWCTPKPAAAHLRQCLASIQHSATLSRLPPRMEWTLQAMDHLLHRWHHAPAPQPTAA